MDSTIRIEVRWTGTLTILKKLMITELTQEKAIKLRRLNLLIENHLQVIPHLVLKPLNQKLQQLRIEHPLQLIKALIVVVIVQNRVQVIQIAVVIVLHRRVTKVVPLHTEAVLQVAQVINRAVVLQATEVAHQVLLTEVRHQVIEVLLQAVAVEDK